MKKLLTALTLIAITTALAWPQSKIAGTAKVGGTAKVSVNAGGGGGAITHIVSSAQALDTDGGTSSAIDTTGANFIAVVVAYFPPTSPTLSDSKSNTWTALTAQVQTGQVAAVIYYAKNATVGSGHTFTVSGSGIYAAIGISAFSDVHTSAPFDVENGAHGNGTSTNTGSITPSQNDEVVIAGLSTETGTSHSIDSGFTASSVNTVGGLSFGLSIAYKIQTTAAAVNPLFSWTGNGGNAAAIASFKKQ